MWFIINDITKARTKDTLAEADVVVSCDFNDTLYTSMFYYDEEVLEYFKMHNADEQRLLWLGFFICNNYIAQRLEDEGMELAKPWPPKKEKK